MWIHQLGSSHPIPSYPIPLPYGHRSSPPRRQRRGGAGLGVVLLGTLVSPGMAFRVPCTLIPAIAATATAAAAFHLGIRASRADAQPEAKPDAGRSDHNRVLTVRGSAHERGSQCGKLLGLDLSSLAASRRALYSQLGLSWWGGLATAAAPSWEAHAPVSWAEKQGMVAAGADERALMLLATDFEMQMASWRHPDFWAEQAPSSPGGRCTGYVLTDGHGLCGQNVDEEAVGWDGGSRDVVLRLLSTEPRTPSALVYTHPGVPACAPQPPPEPDGRRRPSARSHPRRGTPRRRQTAG